LVLIDDANPFRPLPARAHFVADGAPWSLRLGWRDLDPVAAADRMVAAGFGAPPPLALRALGDGTAWISLPTFAPDDAATRTLHQIVAALPGLRESGRIVFDLRGNSGGSSQWGHAIVSALWGAAWARPRADELDEHIDWRVSADNQRHIAAVAETSRARFGSDARLVRVFAQLADDMRAALDRGERWVGQPTAVEPPPDAFAADNPVRARILVLTDGRCGSAALDFLDRLLTLPNVVHIGGVTAADTQYMDVRRVTLPSGAATLGFAMKVYRQRGRGLPPRQPRHLYAGDFGDHAAVERWALALA
jgi:hypothetical protein